AAAESHAAAVTNSAPNAPAAPADGTTSSEIAGAGQVAAPSESPATTRRTRAKRASASRNADIAAEPRNADTAAEPGNAEAVAAQAAGPGEGAPADGGPLVETVLPVRSTRRSRKTVKEDDAG